MPDALMARAKRVASERKTTLRVLMTDALERSLAEQPADGFRLRDASVGAGGRTVDSDAINRAIDEQREGPFRS